MMKQMARRAKRSEDRARPAAEEDFSLGRDMLTNDGARTQHEL